MRKINEQSPETFPNAGIDLKMDPMRTGIPGRKRKVRRGRNARMTRMNEYCAKEGKKIGWPKVRELKRRVKDIIIKTVITGQPSL